MTEKKHQTAPRRNLNIWKGIADGILFDRLPDGKFSIKVCYKNPTAAEIANFKKEQVEIALAEAEQVGFIIVRIGNGPYNACPIFPAQTEGSPRSSSPSHFSEQQISLSLIDTENGECKVLREIPVEEPFAKEMKLQTERALTAARSHSIAECHAIASEVLQKTPLEELYEKARVNSLSH